MTLYTRVGLDSDRHRRDDRMRCRPKYHIYPIAILPKMSLSPRLLLFDDDRDITMDFSIIMKYDALI